MYGTAKELRHIHDYSLASEAEGATEHLHDRWKQLQTDCQLRQRNLQGLMGDLDNQSGSPLQGNSFYAKA